MEKQDLDLFLEMCNHDIYRVYNELSKIQGFGKTQRKFIFKQMLSEGAFNDLSQYGIFHLTNAIQSKNIDEIGKILSTNIEIEPLALISLLYQNFRKMLVVWFDKNPTPDSTGLKSNQIWAIRNLPRNYTKEQLIQIFKFSTFGKLPCFNDKSKLVKNLNNYVIGKILLL